MGKTVIEKVNCHSIGLHANSVYRLRCTCVCIFARTQKYMNLRFVVEESIAKRENFRNFVLKLLGFWYWCYYLHT